MRSMFRGVLVALAAVLTLGVVSASVASAHEYFVEGKSMKERGLKEELVTSEIGSVTMGGKGVEVVCVEGNAGTGTIKEGGTGAMTIEFPKCIVVNPSNCKVKPIVLKKTTDKLVEVGGKLADEFLPEKTGGFLFGVDFENNGGACSLGESEFAGQITGSVVSEAENEVVELSFTNTSGSEIEGDGFTWKLSFKDKVKLSGPDKGKKWSAKK